MIKLPEARLYLKPEAKQLVIKRPKKARLYLKPQNVSKNLLSNYLTRLYVWPPKEAEGPRIESKPH